MTAIDRRHVLRLLGAVGAAGATTPAVAACSSGGEAAAAAPPPVRIGLIVPQSGANKSIGDEMNAGFQLYLKLHSNRLAGRPAQVTTADEGDGVDGGRAAADQLIKSSVHVLSGVASSAVMSGIRDQVESAQVPLLGSAGSPGTLGSVEYIWRTSYLDSDPGTALGRYLAGKHDRSVYVVSDGSSAAMDQVAAFIAAFNGTVGHPQLAAPPAQLTTGSDLTQAVGKIVEARAANVFMALSGDLAASFLRSCQAAGLGKSLYAPGFLTEGADALQRLGQAAMGLYTAMNYAPDLDNTANRTFASQYQELYGTSPSAYAMTSYDAAAVLDKALGFAGADLSPQSLNTALSSVGQLDSPRGQWQFNQSRTPLQRWYLRQVRRDGSVISNRVIGDIGMLG